MLNRDTLVASVLVITYNQEKTISQTLDSILSQKCNFNFDIVVGEDCSTDKTRDIVIDYANKNPQIKLLLAKKNKGLLINYRDTLLHCSGKYIAQCAGDDWWHNPLKLQKQVEFLDLNQDYGMVYSNYDCYFEESSMLKNNCFNSNGVYSGDIFDNLLFNNFIFALTVCFSKKYLDKYVDINLSIKENFLMEDYPLWLQLAYYTKIGFINESLATYRILKNSVSHFSTVQKKIQFYTSILEIKKYFIDNFHVNTEHKYNILRFHYSSMLFIAFSENEKLIAKKAWIERRKEKINFSFIDYLRYYGVLNRYIYPFSKILIKFISVIKRILF